MRSSLSVVGLGWNQWGLNDRRRRHPRRKLGVPILVGVGVFLVMAGSGWGESRDGNGAIEISGELRPWHRVTLTLEGPFAQEAPGAAAAGWVNPFRDRRLMVRFRHPASGLVYTVPGYFAADGVAGETSATEGNRWRAHLNPDHGGRWEWEIEFRGGRDVALALEEAGESLSPWDGLRGEFTVEAAGAGAGKTDAAGAAGFGASGRLIYDGGRYFRFAGSGEAFLKMGPDAPETLLGYADFDGTRAAGKRATLKTWEPHLGDWREGDPEWQGGKGRGLIGAVNYLAARGCNAMSFLTYNAGGDGDNVWPFVDRDDPLRYDCSKLDQWGVVFEHAQRRGVFLHFKLQETENDDDRKGNKDGGAGEKVEAALDGGDLGVERKLYLREMVARFGDLPGLEWNLGEENTQTTEQQRDMARYLRALDPYGHPIVLHTFPNQQEAVYEPFLGEDGVIDGLSLQNSWNRVHQLTVNWVRRSEEAGHPWVVANDEQNPAGLGVPPDPGYRGHDGVAREKGSARGYDLHDIRKATLWGNLLGGGAGVMYYFGYGLPENDLDCEDFRSRERSWDYGRIALDFFRDEAIPISEMRCLDALAGNAEHGNEVYVFAQPGSLYLVYLPEGKAVDLDLSGESGTFAAFWFDPRNGGAPRFAEPGRVKAVGVVRVAAPPGAEKDGEDWLVMLRRDAE